MDVKPSQQQVFETPKHLQALSVSAYPAFTKSARVYTNASDTRLGAVLPQMILLINTVVVFGSLSTDERNHRTTKKECLSICSLGGFTHSTISWLDNHSKCLRNTPVCSA